MEAFYKRRKLMNFYLYRVEQCSCANAGCINPGKSCSYRCESQRIAFSFMISPLPGSKATGKSGINLPE